MRKLKLLLILLLSVCLLGCEEKRNKKTKLESENSVENTTENSWEKVNQAFEKLKKIPVEAIGLHTELAHFSTTSKVGEKRNKQNFTAMYDQALFKVHISDSNNVQINVYSLTDMIDKGKLGVHYLKEELTYENLKKDHLSPLIGEMSPYVYAIENGIFKENGQIKELDEYDRESDYLDYLENFKKSESGFLKRGKTIVRLIPNDYFEGTITNNEIGEVISFKFDKDTDDYRNKIAKFNEEYGPGSSYDVIEYTIECEADDEGASHYSGTDQNGNEIEGYSKPGMKEDFIGANIIVQLDKEGYPISYYRESVFEYKDFGVQVPYVVSYTFTRI